MPQTAIVATVPPQHMYGFESSLLMAWQSGNAIVAERPFYPADIAMTLAGLPGRRMLVTTPFHLRALIGYAVDGDAAVPHVDTIVCATAPLSTALAERAERETGAPVLEIYGCTETGQLASRRPTVDPLWLPFGDIVLHFDGARAIASGGHVEEPTMLGDVIEPAADFATTRRFALAGRATDLVNIAGKRTSLGHLNVQLNAIDGVVDGVFVMPEDDDADPDGVTRLAAIVVAPALTAASVLAALRTRIDPVFLPRPLYCVDRLPRNALGKLTHAALHDVVAGQRSRPAADASVASGEHAT
jgi:acyl-coenzyme A synthetase/AMP-(fatty) acid ligase